MAEHLWELLVNFLLPAPSLYKTEKFIVLLLIPTIKHTPKFISNIQYFFVPNIGHFLFRTSVILCSEHPVLFRSEHRSFFVSNICHFMFRTSCIFRSEHLDDFHSEHPVFFIPTFRRFHSEHPETEVRNGLLRPMSVKKKEDEKGPPRFFGPVRKSERNFGPARKFSGLSDQFYTNSFKPEKKRNFLKLRF